MSRELMIIPIREKTENVKNPNMKDIYETYVVWKTLPLVMKKQGSAFVREKLQIEDNIILELSDISTQGEFAKKYEIHTDTLTKWNKTIREKDEFAGMREWMKPMLRNVMLSTYNVALKADPKANADRRFFMEFAGWTQELNINHKVEGLNDLLKEELRQRRLKNGKGNGQSLPA